MNVADALANRRSVRKFLDTPVPTDLLKSLIAAASRAPSGGNLQPWHIRVVTGAARSRLVDAVGEQIAAGVQSEPGEYDIYPKGLTPPYADRRFAIGEALYARLAIPREDRPARRAWFHENFRLFGAPVGLFCFVDRQMGPPQWSDLGMFLQSLMLLLVENGLASCPQECWAMFPGTVARILYVEPQLMLFTGMSIGYEDHDAAVNALRSDRAPLTEFTRFLDA